MFVDASAIVAILCLEPEAQAFSDAISKAGVILVAPISIFEATLAVARVKQCKISVAEAEVLALLSDALAKIVAIDESVGKAAIQAFTAIRQGPPQGRAEHG